MRERGRYKENSLRRKGKSLEELYGEEQGKKAIEKIREARLRQADPRLGKRHSVESRLKMSIKRLDKPTTRGIRGQYYSYSSNSFQRFDSSLEYVVFVMLDIKGEYWERNNTLAIPYIDKKGITRHYIPDVLIYNDSTRKSLVKIIEIKPQAYLDDPDSYFYEVIKLKQKIAENFCQEHTLTYGFITDKDIYTLFYNLNILDKKYKTFYTIVRLAKEFLNGETDLYKKYQENLLSKGGTILLCDNKETP